MSNTSIGEAFIAQSRALLTDEYRIKLRKSVAALPADALWWRANATSNSVGNLLLHLAGNIRQHIVSGIGETPDVRDRTTEFGADGGADAVELMGRLDDVLDQADAILARLRPEDLERERTVAGARRTVLEIIYTTVQHAALHLGQIIMIAKERTPGSVRFYEDTPKGGKAIWRDAR
ncbi:MAG TPA: DUF1572 family protein [Gemmatimonadaceae bacterium]